MITIENRTNGASFHYQDDRFVISGNYLVLDEDKTFKSLSIVISEIDGSDKGDAYIRDEELIYNFTGVKPSEVSDIAELCEMCLAEIKKAL